MCRDLLPGIIYSVQHNQAGGGIRVHIVGQGLIPSFCRRVLANADLFFVVASLYIVLPQLGYIYS